MKPNAQHPRPIRYRSCSIHVGANRRREALVEYIVAGTLMTIGVVMSFTVVGGAVGEAIGSISGALQMADAGSAAGAHFGSGG